MKQTIAIAIILLSTACGQPTTEHAHIADTATPTLADTLWSHLHGLSGHWATAPDTSGMRTFENWMLADSTHWTGLGYVMAGTDTVSIEELRMVRTGDSIAYGARLTTQNGGEWVDFAMQPTGADTLLFTDPDHDFPQRIAYVRQGPHWHATVSGEGGAFELHFAPMVDSAMVQH